MQFLAIWMSKFELLDDLIDSVYAVDLGLSEDEGQELYVRMLANVDWRSRISEEINLAFLDTNFSWKDFFDEHDLYAADSEREARIYAEKIILEPLRSKGKVG
jgi:hypothetical protein